MESAFCEIVPPDCRLIETFRYTPGFGAVDLGLHLNRMCDSARQLGFAFDRDLAEHICDGLSGNKPLRCRLTLGVKGDFQLSHVPLDPTPAVWQVDISDTRLNTGDAWLAHKTTQRDIYDTTRANLPRGIHEMLFLNERDELCEGTITNVFVETQGGTWVTPPISAGCLPGILRQKLIKSGEVIVKTVTLGDLMAARSVVVGNSLRGKIRADLNRT